MSAARKAMAIPILLAVLASAGRLSGRSLELSLSYGRWSSFPFTSLIESQCRKMIEYELTDLMGWAAPLLSLWNERQDLQFTSSGEAIHSELKYHFPASRLAVGLEASWQRLDLPYRLDYLQSVELLGVTIARARTVAGGVARIRSLDASAWLHWRLCRAGKFACSLAAGLHLMPLKGEVSLQGHASLQSIAGDTEVDLNDRQSTSELRRAGLNIPRALLFPALALSSRYMISRNFGVQARLAVSQGAMLSLGFTTGN